MSIAILLSFLFPLAAGLGLEHMLYGAHSFGEWFASAAFAMLIGLIGCFLASVHVFGSDGYAVINPMVYVGGGTTVFLSFINLAWGDHRLFWMIFLIAMAVLGALLTYGMDRYEERVQSQRRAPCP